MLQGISFRDAPVRVPYLAVGATGYEVPTSLAMAYDQALATMFAAAITRLQQHALPLHLLIEAG